MGTKQVLGSTCSLRQGCQQLGGCLSIEFRGPCGLRAQNLVRFLTNRILQDMPEERSSVYVCVLLKKIKLSDYPQQKSVVKNSRKASMYPSCPGCTSTLSNPQLLLLRTCRMHLQMDTRHVDERRFLAFNIRYRGLEAHFVSKVGKHQGWATESVREAAPVLNP